VFAAPILYTLQELAKGEAGLLDRLSTAPARAGQPPRRIELSWGIVLHPMKTRPLPPATHSNAYLVGDREMALVDPGSGDPHELESLFKLVDDLDRDGRRVGCIVLTHHHDDHVAGAEAARERFGVPICASTAYAGGVRVERRLSDGEILSLESVGELDWNLRVIHTPGHTRDHLCLFHERTGSLLTGDHVVGGTGTVIIDPPDGDMAAYVASLERLLALPVRTLYPGHGSPQGAAKRRIKHLLAHRRQREEQVLAALEAEPRELDALVERAYADTPRPLWRYAERSLLAHLLKLELAGLATRDGERWRRP
jgi:glyoxylase-like metal-dependent hydrolase (beta-lactamase superfamily II)